MQCAICSRSAGSKLPFHCPACARHSLYELRVEHARHLLAREASGRKVEDVVSRDQPKPPPSSDDDHQRPKTTAPAKIVTRWDLYQAAMQRHEADLHTREIHAQAECLRSEIEKARTELSTLKAALARRRTDFASATHNLVSRRRATLESVDKTTKRTTYRADQQHQRTAESRVFLCREAAKLYGLRQRRRTRGEGFKDEYLIGGVGIVDLKNLNNASYMQITTSFAHVCHLLVLASHYLSLQLPAEITLPHRDYPAPTIYSPSASYLARPTMTQGSASSAESHAASRASDTRSLPRPRPLSLDRPLPQLARDDPAAHSLFIEGVTLLAWDVAWACRTQGINIGSQSWDEICSIGRNLWSLLVSPPSSSLPPVMTPRRPSSRTPGDIPRNEDQTVPTTMNAMGYYSHGTAHSFLGSAEGMEFMQGWKLNGPIAKTVDQLKSFLVADMAGLEWEVLENDVEGDNTGPDGVRVPDGVKPEIEEVNGGRQQPAQNPARATDDSGSANGQMRTLEKRRNEAVDEENHDYDEDSHHETRMMLGGAAPPPPREKSGTSGWMKLRSRS